MASRYGPRGPAPPATPRWLGWLAALVLLAHAPGGIAAAGIGDVAFFYGHAPPVDQLAHFDRVVVQPDALEPSARRRLARHARPVAYVAVGEAVDAGAVTEAATLGRNPAWDRPVMDLTSAHWREHLVARIDRLVASGYTALFLDTLDSYRLALTGERARARQRRALARLIRRVHRAHPGLELIVNRGFRVLPAVHEVVDAVVAESLYAGWHQGAGRYVEVAPDDRAWLLERLQRARAEYGLAVVVVDYVAPGERERAREVARRIAAHGFTPYVTNADLDMLGVGRLEVVPRRVLVLRGADEALATSSAFDLAGPILEYLGYRPVYRRVDGDLPDHPLPGRYAGVVAWLGELTAASRRRLQGWLQDRVVERVPLVLLGAPVVRSPELLEQMGLAPTQGRPRGELEVTRRTELARGFEGRPEARHLGVSGWRSVDDRNRVAFGFRDGRGRRWDPIVTGPWGGAALTPYVVEPLVGDHSRWLIHPFRFFRRALGHTPFPVPDPTTENGRRILTAHIDGDGFASRAKLAGRPRAAAVIERRILAAYDVPTTVSVIEGELRGKADTAALEARARSIFARPAVEAASHTYSHPYDWSAALASPGAARQAYASDLVPSGYRVDLAREIGGSVRYIQQNLVPEGRRVAAFLWSGNALPPARAIERVEALGLANINGGDTRPTRRFPSVTEVSPHVRPTAGGLQFFAPIMNENVYTDGWTGPYDGYRRAAESFALTGRPRRLKPLGIYYHFYSGTRPASLAALKHVYERALEREPLALWVSQYVDRVRGFRRATLARDLAGGWHVRGLAGLRTLRWPDGLARPRLDASTAVAGWRETPVGRYVHLSAAEARLEPRAASRARPSAVRLVEANAVVERWRRAGPEEVDVRLSGHRPLRLHVQAPGNGSCRLPGVEGLERVERDAGGTRFVFTRREGLDATLVCH